MTTKELTVRERVEQAVARQFELLAERVVFQQEVKARTNVKNELRAHNPTTKEEGFLDAQAEGVHSAENAYDKQVAVIARPLARAQAVYDEKELVIHTERQVALTKAAADYEKAVADTLREFDIAMASADAEIYRAEQEVRAQNDTIKQHAQVIKESLGIDLNALANV